MLYLQLNQHQLTELERHLEAFKLMRDEAIKAVLEIRQQVQNTTNDISAAVSTVSEHYKLLISESDDYIKEHVKISNELLEKFASETKKGITSVGTRLTGSSDLISKSIDIAAKEFTNNAAKTNQSLQTSSDVLQSQTEVIKQHLQDAGSDLNSTIRDMTEKLVTDAKDMTATMKKANKDLVRDTEQMRDIVVKSAEKL